MRENDMFDAFEYHATGGIVANMSSDMSIPCVIYILPLIPLLNEAKRVGRNYLNFHILGGANFRDVLFYELFRVVVKKKHNIDLNITYDSSGIYKQIMHARFMNVKNDQGYIMKMNIKSNNLDKKFLERLSVHDMSQRIFDDMANTWGFKQISVDGMYDPARNTFWEDVKTYAILYAFDFYYHFQHEMRQFAEAIYPMWESGCKEELYEELFNVTRVINQGKLTKKQKIKAHSIPRSMDILASLDEDMCYSLVKTYLSKDEFVDLDERTKVLTV